MDVPRKFWHRWPGGESSGQDDELEHVAVGDRDPTWDAGMANSYRKCRFEWDDVTSRTLVLRWSCTRELGHPGQHLAGTGEEVAAVHPQFLQYRDAISRCVVASTSNTPWLASCAVRRWVTVMCDRLAAGRQSQLSC